MSKLFEELETKKIKQIINEYKKNGYTVYSYPELKEKMPDFLKDYSPDIFAFNDKENVIIEIKTKESKFKNNFEKISRILESKPDWRMEIIFTNPKDKNIIASKNLLLDETQIQKRRENINNLINSDSLDASFLLGWATLESQIRFIAKNENIEENKSIRVLVKTLYSLGIINNREYNSFKSLFRVRNEIVHGYYIKVDKNTIKKLLTLIDELAKIKGEIKSTTSS